MQMTSVEDAIPPRERRLLGSRTTGNDLSHESFGRQNDHINMSDFPDGNPGNPYNWSARLKWMMLLLISTMSMLGRVV